MELLPREEQLHAIFSQYRLFLKCLMRFSNTPEIATRKLTGIYKAQKILQLKGIYSLEMASSCKNSKCQLPATFNEC